MKRSFSLLLLFALLSGLAVSQVAGAAASSARPTTFAHPTLRDDAAEPEEEFEAEELELNSKTADRPPKRNSNSKRTKKANSKKKKNSKKTAATAGRPRPRRRVRRS